MRKLRPKKRNGISSEASEIRKSAFLSQGHHWIHSPRAPQLRSCQSQLLVRSRSIQPSLAKQLLFFHQSLEIPESLLTAFPKRNLTLGNCLHLLWFPSHWGRHHTGSRMFS